MSMELLLRNLTESSVRKTKYGIQKKNNQLFFDVFQNVGIKMLEMTPGEAASLACIAVRKYIPDPEYFPDNDALKMMIKACSLPGKLEYVGELDGPVFSYMRSDGTVEYGHHKSRREPLQEAEGKKRGRPKIDRPDQNPTAMNKLFFDQYIKYLNGTYQIKDPETGELKAGRAMSQVAAAQRACTIVRNYFKNKSYRPDRNTLTACGKGKQALSYSGERDGKAVFSYSFGTNAACKGDDIQEYRTPGAKNKPKDSSAKPAEKSSDSGAKRGPKALGPKDDIYTQFYKHYKNKGLSDHEAKIKANSSWKKYKEKQSTNESKKDERALLKEAIMKLIPSVLQEAATVNLAKFSDENASVTELPVIINNLENIITEIDSFNIKMQAKIQGVFDSIGNLKNEDGISIGYKFAKPILDSFAEDLAPVLEKTDFANSVKLPEAPAPDQTQVVDPNNPESEAPLEAAPEEKQTVFSPAATTAPDPAEIAGAAAKAAINLRESRKPKGRYIR